MRFVLILVILLLLPFQITRSAEIVVVTARIDSTFAVSRGFTPASRFIFTTWATVCDKNGVTVDSIPVVVIRAPYYDVNHSGRINVVDLTRLVGFLFRGTL